MEIFIVFGAGALALITLAGAVGLIVLSDGPFAAALARRGSRTDRVAATSAANDKLRRQLEDLGARLGKGSANDVRRRTVRAKLVQAGFYSDRALDAFYGVRILTALAFGLVAILVALVLRIVPSPPLLLGVLATVGVGLFLPNAALENRVRSRAQAMKVGLPDAVDLMVVSVEAGGTISAAMQRVAREFGDLHPVLADQFRMTLMEMQAGSSRAEALQRLAQRVASEDVGALVTLVIQSEALGASIGDTMRAFADQLRNSRYLDAERRASELPVKMAFPLVLGIFPALAVVIFTPVVIRFVRVLFQVGES